MVPLAVAIAIGIAGAGLGFGGAALIFSPQAKSAEAAAKSAQAAADAAQASANAVENAVAPFVLEGQARLELSDLVLAEEALGHAFVVREGEASEINWVALDASREFHCRAQSNAGTGATTQVDCKPLSEALVTKSILAECKEWALWLNGSGQVNADADGNEVVRMVDVTSQGFQRDLATCIAEFSKKH